MSSLEQENTKLKEEIEQLKLQLKEYKRKGAIDFYNALHRQQHYSELNRNYQRFIHSKGLGEEVDEVIKSEVEFKTEDELLKGITLKEGDDIDWLCAMVGFFPAGEKRYGREYVVESEYSDRDDCFYEPPEDKLEEEKKEIRDLFPGEDFYALIEDNLTYTFVKPPINIAFETIYIHKP